MLKLRHALFLFHAIAWLVNRVATTHRTKLKEVSRAVDCLKEKKAVLAREVAAAETFNAKMQEFIGG